MSVLAKRLKQIRNENNVTQTALAKAVNKSRVVVTAYETGSRLPDVETIVAIADFFGEDINWLLGRTDFRPASQKLNNAFSRLTDSDRELIENLIYSLAEKCEL